MFKKAQIKLFLIITSILIAIFIFVLASINILTQTVMQRQSRKVLEDIASGVEYDDETSTFVLVHFRNDFFPKRNKMFEEVPSDKPAEEPVQTAVSSDMQTSTETASTTTATTAETTEEQTQEQTEEVTETEEITEPEPEETEEIQEQPPEVQAVNEIQPENNIQSPEQQQATEAPALAVQPPTEAITVPEETQDDDSDDDDEIEEAQKKEEEKRKKEEFEREKEKYREWERFKRGDEMPYDFSFPPYYSEEPFCGEYDPCYPFGLSFTDTSQLYGNTIELANTVQATQSDTNTQPPFKPDEFMGNPEQYGMRNGNSNTKNGEPVPKTLGSIDFFVIMADTDGKYASTLNNDDINEETAQNYITAILDAKKDTGMLNSYQYYMAEKNNGTLMVFTDKSDEIKVLKQLTRTTVIIGGISLILLSVAAYFLSKKSLEPLKSAFEKQKRFISDASHELKTPLTVISANADVLSGEIGHNKWLEYIKAQTDRMNVLVNELLNLTRLENNTAQFVKTDFNLSQAVTNTALPFECQAFESNKKFIVDVEDGLTVNGSEQHIKQLTAIFIDNALKYSNDGGMVRVKLRGQGEKKVLSVYNTGQGVKDSEKDKIFERFYRSDDSRSRMTGGYGLGLAIAKSIIEKHKFKIDIENDEGKSICFIITM